MLPSLLNTLDICIAISIFIFYIFARKYSQKINFNLWNLFIVIFTLALAVALVRFLSNFAFQYIQYPFAKGLVEGGDAMWVESNLHIFDCSISIDSISWLLTPTYWFRLCCAHFGSVFSIYYYYAQTLTEREIEKIRGSHYNISPSRCLFLTARFPFPNEFD